MNDEFDSQHDEELANLLTELTDRVQQGDIVDLELVCQSHPQVATELRQLWGAVMVAQAAASLSQADVPNTQLASQYDHATLNFELPCRLGDYELLEEIGKGGMGVVYRARQISLNREVAVKMILRGQFATPADRRRFRAEAEAVARLAHPGIVPVYEVGEIDGSPYFSMKYLKGRTLAQLLADGILPPRDAARILAAVARSIDFAHEQGVLHRDLKPSNILLDEHDEPHVTDFGLAKKLAEDASLTRSNAVVGTPAYMAPEQASAGREQVGPASDVFSLGTILYQTLTGRPPFQAASPVDTILMLRDQDVVPPRVVNPRADRDLELIALRCLQKPVPLRYESAGALADDLEAYLNDEPIAARSGHLGQIFARWFRETHHATVLENWGVLWMWHSLVLLIACALTNALHAVGWDNRWYYIALWTVGLWIWAGVFWWLRRRMGPVTFVERQIAHVWAGSMVAIGLLFFVELQLNLPVPTLSPVLGLIAGMVFLIKAGILTGTFYVAAAALFLVAFAMARMPAIAHLLFGVVAAACFFIPGLLYSRRRSEKKTHDQGRAGNSFPKQAI